MRRYLLAAAALATAVAGSASAQIGNVHGPTGGDDNNLPGRETVFAVVGSRVLIGETGSDRDSRVRLRDEDQPGYACIGALYDSARATASPMAPAGRFRFQCSDGAQFVVGYHPFPSGSGVASGVFDGQRVSICYGYDAHDALRHLRAPAGYALVAEHGRLSLKAAGA